MPIKQAQLRQAPLLAALTEEQLERVLRRATKLQLDEGQWLFSQNDPATRFYFVQRGKMRLFRLSADGDEKIIELVGPGQTFAEALMFMGTGRYPVCAAALDPTELVGIDADDFAAMLRESPETCFALLGALSQRLHRLIAEIDNLTLHSATGRVTRWLLAQLPDGRGELALSVRKSVIASRLSIKPETWSRITRRLADRGMIAVDGQHISVLDRDALQRLADEDEAR
jgi:CRP-like cAMP-binding protein